MSLAAAPTRSVRNATATIVALVALLLPPTSRRGVAQVSESLPVDSVHPGAYLEVYLLTAGPGDAIWEKFGHNAVRLVDRREGLDLSWNWGVFDFDQEGFMARLIRGRMLYSMRFYPAEFEIARYRDAGRPVWQQELRLTPEEKWALREAIRVNWQPENRDYRYDYYRDNCSTRVRDVLDRALGGRLRAALGEQRTEHTYRWHTRRLLQRSPLAYIGIQFVLGSRADEPLTRWEEAFLPMRLRDAVRDVEGTDLAGRTADLVAEEYQIVHSDRAAVPGDVPSFLVHFALVGVLVALALGGSAALAARGRSGARVVFSFGAAAWILAAGTLGSILLGAWLFTDHVFWAWNENLLQAHPLFLILLLPVVDAVRRGRVPGWAVTVATAIAALSLLGFALQALPPFDQVNGEILAFTVPANLALAFGFRRLRADR